MGTATHLGPWVLGTVKNTTGSTAGTIRNLGITTVLQYSSSLVYTASAASTGIVIPAGAIITDIFIIQTTQFTSGTSGTMTALINGTSFAAGTVTGAGSMTNIIFAPTSASTANYWLNSSYGQASPTDGIITITGATLTAGAGVLCVHYGVRNSDGTFVGNP
jgi:hypothetical protein